MPAATRMNSSHDKLNSYFAQTKGQPSLLSRSDVETIVRENVPAATSPATSGRNVIGGTAGVLAVATLVLLLLLGDGAEERVVTPNVTTTARPPATSPADAAHDRSSPKNARETVATGTVSAGTVATERVATTAAPRNNGGVARSTASRSGGVASPMVIMPPQADGAATQAVEKETVPSTASHIASPTTIAADPSLPSLPALPHTERIVATITNPYPLPETLFLSEKIEISDLAELNTEGDDYNATVTPDGRTLYFVSNNSNSMGGHDIWSAIKRDQGERRFSSPTNLGSGINSAGLDQGGITIAPDGTTMYYTLCDGGCNIHEARWTPEHGWTEVGAVAELNSSEWDGQPNLSSDGRALYFVSTRPGGVGDADIYVAERDVDGRWSTPRNLGAPINTKKKEDSPCVLPGETALYFSSRGHKGRGGFDLFVAQRSPEGSWQKPVNLGPEINSDGDERFLSVPASENTIYFAKSGGDGRLDLYVARFAGSSTSVVVRGKVRWADKFDYIRADLLFVDGSTGEVIAEGGSSTADGGYTLVLDSRRGANPPVIDIYGRADAVGVFHTRLTLQPSHTYREYDCDIILERIEEARSTTDAIPPDSSLLTVHVDDRMLTIPADQQGEEATRLVNAWGEEVYRGEIPSSGIALKSYPPGLYHVRSGARSTIIRIDESSD